MGCWAAYELLRAARYKNLALPSHAVLACMPAPTLPPETRPWTPQDTLDDGAFQVRYCSGKKHKNQTCTNNK